jgi:hypothetical protein
MFYQEEVDKAYRFGDVLKGFVLSYPNIDEPILKDKHYDSQYSVNIIVPEYCIILTPCCSIGEKSILLTPLIKIHKNFYKNPYFADNLLNINSPMEPEQSVSPDVWVKFDVDEKQKRLSASKGYAALEYFIYEKHHLFQEYLLGNLTTQYYMIDFRNIFKVNSDRIPNQKQAPLEAKCLQLSVNARKELREKLSYYFFRAAPEDEMGIEL